VTGGREGGGEGDCWSRATKENRGEIPSHVCYMMR
jgi:hypothetical protein